MNLPSFDEYWRALNWRIFGRVPEISSSLKNQNKKKRTSQRNDHNSSIQNGMEIGKTDQYVSTYGNVANKRRRRIIGNNGSSKNSSKNGSSKNGSSKNGSSITGKNEPVNLNIIRRAIFDNVNRNQNRGHGDRAKPGNAVRNVGGDLPSNDSCNSFSIGPSVYQSQAENQFQFHFQFETPPPPPPAAPSQEYTFHGPVNGFGNGNGSMFNLGNGQFNLGRPTPQDQKQKK